jgi:uncharacterized protein YecT (DUF1311 family)
MKIRSGYVLTLTIGLMISATGCSNSKKEPPKAAAAPEDTMLLRDLAEANKNTASAAAMDNSLTTIRTAGDTTPVPTSSGTRVQPASVLTSSTPTTRVRTVDTTKRTTPRQPDKTASASTSTGDPCDSPTAADQRTCLNRSIVANDADLNSTYQEVIAQSRTSGGPDLEARLREAQRAWINDRDMACRPNSDSGLWARAVARCLADYSARRTAELRRTLSGLRGQ